MSLALVPIFLLLGALIGFLSGLLGIGGGFTMVPVLAEVFDRQGIGVAHLMPLAIGTSSATIVFTAYASVRAHHRRGAVVWPIVVAMAPGLLLGSFAGPQVASALPMRVMAGIFGAVTWFASARMLWARPPRTMRALPGRPAMFGVGAVIGLVAGMVGTGGAFLAVPFMTRCNVKVHSAVATSAAIGWPVALASTGGFVYAGWHAGGLPPYALGYVYLPALAGIVVMSMLLAPLGARVAHASSVARLRRVFAIMLAVLGGWMWWKALG
jgi:uncharacterized membrane protein YfcA